MPILDLVIIGAGPAGLSVAIEAKQANLDYVVVERGTVTNSIMRYPIQMKFFSTAELLAIGNVPFTTPNANPTRLEGLAYYRNVVQHFDLKMRLAEEVQSITPSPDGFVVKTSRGEITTRFVVVATGYFDNPVMLGIPGENLPNVSHYYTEAAPFFHRKVTIIGSQNSAAESALELYANHAHVTLIARKPTLGTSVKYWLKPNLENRIKAGAIKAHFNAELRQIEPERVLIENTQTHEEQWIDSDYVLALTGYHPDTEFLRRLGINSDSMSLVPEYNPDTLESNVTGVFIAGSVACGCETGTVFIENGRLHAYTIIGVIKRRLADTKKTRIIE